MKLFMLLVILLSCYDKLLAAESVCGADWLPYKDEKCFRVIDDTLRTFDDAQKACAVLKNEPSLVIIRSKEEQDFLSNYLFKTLKKEDNFWIGAKYSVNASHYKWLDNSDLGFTNWVTMGVTNKEGRCIQIQADERMIGKWIDAPCGKSNKLVCQKLQTWSMARLQKEFLDERKQHRDALESTEHKLAEANEKIRKLESNLVPVGFIYVQLPHQPEPKTLWSNVQWKDVTSEYSGLFFRAEGPNATAFGSVQEENAPRVTQVQNLEYFTFKHPEWDSTNLIAGGWSSGVGVFSGSLNDKVWYTHKFYQSGGEIRPRNMAMRFWKRI